MDYLEKILGLKSGGVFIVHDLQIRGWGRELVFACTHQYAPDDAPLPFTITFKDCRELKWRVYVHAEASTQAALGNFTPGRDAHRSPAHLLTDSFGLSLFYGDLEVTRS